MYQLRPFQPSDWDAVRSLHAQKGFTFAIPQTLKEAVVVEDEDTRQVVQVLGLRETRECFLWLDGQWATPRWRWDAFSVAHGVLQKTIQDKGTCEDVKLWTNIPGFSRKLVKRLGWTENKYPSFTLDL